MSGGGNQPPSWADKTFEGGAKTMYGCLAVPVVAILIGVGLFVASNMTDKPENQADVGAVENSADSASVYSIPDADLSKVCRAGVAMAMGRRVSIMQVTGISDGIAAVQYRRPDDKKLWKYECRVDGNRIEWRTIDATPGAGAGRWRITENDEVLTYVQTGNSVTVYQRYPGDRSISHEIFDVKD